MRTISTLSTTFNKSDNGNEMYSLYSTKHAISRGKLNGVYSDVYVYVFTFFILLYNNVQ